MAIYIPSKNVEIKEKKSEQGQLVKAVQQKTYTQEEVLAMMNQIQEGENKS